MQNVPRHAKREEDSLKAEKNAPYHHTDYNHLQRGKPIKKYNKDDLFETGKNNKKKNNKSKQKTPILTYKNDFHFN